MADRRPLDFQFDSIQTAGNKKWLVSVFEKGMRLCFFEMQKTHDHWQIINAPKVPDYFLHFEKMLDQVLKDYERNENETNRKKGS